MKKTFKRLINFAMAILMLVSSLLVMPLQASASNYNCTMTLEELQTVFPEGRYWNHVGLSNWSMTTTTSTPCTSYHRHGNCKYNGGCGCNSYKGKAIQCMGFAYALQDLAFNGFDGYDASENWNYSNAMLNLKAGDVIRYYSGSYKHSIFVTKVDGDIIEFMDCNGTGGGCIIRHNETITKSALKSKFLYVSHAPNELVSSSVTKVNLYQTAIVTANNGLTIRKSPNINSAKIGTLSKNSNVSVINYPITDNYGYVWRKLLDGQGWVCSNYLKITGGNCIISGTYRIQCANGKFLSYCTTPRNDVNVVAYEELAGTNIENLQLWKITPLFYCSDEGSVVYRISPVSDTKYSLDCDVNNRKALHLWQNYDIGAQQWIIEVCAGGGIKLLNNASRYALEIENGNNNNNAEIITNTASNVSRQKFNIVEP